MTKYREVLGEIQPHYVTAAIAAVTIAASSYAAAQQAKQARRAKRGSANANNMPQGMAQVTAPTADRFHPDEGGDSSRLSDILGKGSTMPASEKQQGFSLGVKHLGEDVPNQPEPYMGSLRTSDTTQPNAQIIPQQEQPPPQQPVAGADTAGQVGNYAQTAATLYGLYQQMRDANKVQPGQRPPMNGINMQPTAQRFGV